MMLSIEKRKFAAERIFLKGDKLAKSAKLKSQDRVSLCPNGDIIKKFKESGSIYEPFRTGRSTILTQETVGEILGSILQMFTKSMRKFDIDIFTSVWTLYKYVNTLITCKHV